MALLRRRYTDTITTILQWGLGLAICRLSHPYQSRFTTSQHQVWDDYRLAAAMGIYLAYEYCRGGINNQGRWPAMSQRTLVAVAELNGSELW